MTDATDEGIEHLQTAAREMVSAARSFLDAIDEVIDDRERFGSIANVLADLVERAGSAISSVSPVPSGPKGTPRVQRIKVE